MSQWDERIRDHAVWQQMGLLGPAIDQAIPLSQLDAVGLAGLERVRAALAFIGKRLAATDPLIAFPAPFDAIASLLSQAREAIQAFTGGRDASGVANANTAVDSALGEVMKVPTLETPEELGALARSAIASRADFERQLKEAQEFRQQSTIEANRLKESFGELSNAFQREREQLTQVVSDHQRQFSEGQEKRNQEFATTLASSQQELTRLTSEHQAQFSAGQDQRSTQFVAVSSQQENSFKEMLETFRSTLSDRDAVFAKDEAELRSASAQKTEDLHQEYAAKSQKLLSEIESDKLRVEKLVGVIGNLGVTSGYLRAANHARRTMWMWQSITVAAMISLSFMAYKTLYLLSDDKGAFNWGGFAGRVVFLASLGVIAAYAGTQADKLFNSERRNRRLALELEAIGPYLAPLPTDEQNKFRVQIGEKSFGQEEIIAAAGEKSPATLFALANSKEGKQLLELLVELVKKIK